MENCNCHNEIILPGSGQLERYLKALDPNYVSIDGRSIEDLLVFAQGYADQIRFYDMPGSPVIDNAPAPKVSWIEFFKRDMAVIAASISTVDVAAIKAAYDAASDQLQAAPSIELYSALFDHIVGIVNKIDQWYTTAIPENPLHDDISLAISSTLASELNKAISYEEGFVVVDQKALNIDYTKILNQDLWGLNAPVDANFDIYQGTTPEEKILNAAPFVDDVFHAFLGVISNIVDQSESYLQFALTQYPGHQPYMTLFIAFLQIFKLAQDQMNGLTARMLDFYYHDVLHLDMKPAIPDKVFVVFQLAQNVADYDLSAGTSLAAGKDASGKDQVYQTENDFVINQATVKELKNAFIEKVPVDSVNEATKTINAIYDRPAANSLDGYGAKFPVPNSKWPTFGTGAFKNVLPRNICEFIDKTEAEINIKNTAAIGFAVASPQLVLQGGNRLIQNKISINLASITDEQKSALDNTLNNIQLAFTAEKGWLPVTRVMTATEQKDALNIMGGIFPTPNTTSNYFATSGLFLTREAVPVTEASSAVVYNIYIYVYLPMGEQGVIGYSPKLHPGETYNTTNPVMKVMIGPDIDISAYLFQLLKVSNISIAVQVGSINSRFGQLLDLSPKMDGLKTLIIKNDNGPVALGKAFDPFTLMPAAGMSFYVGSEEIFNKPFDADPGNNQLSVHINKTQQDDSQSEVGVAVAVPVNFMQAYRVYVLKNRTWQQLTDFDQQDFSQATLTGDILYVSKGNPVALPRAPIEHISSPDVNTDKGFLRIDNIQTQFAQDTVQTRLDNAPRFQIKDISLNYLSTLQRLDPAIDQFFHIYPFGVTETTISTPIYSFRTIGGLGDIRGGLGNVIRSEASAIGVTPIRVRPRITVAKETDPLVVNGHNYLLPQFTYLSPTSQYSTDASDKQTATDLELIQTSRSPKYSGDRILDKLILDASGLNEEISGGNNQYSGQIQEEGLLFIGVDKLQPLQTLSLLFQFADGSAADEDNDPPAINWSYLIYNEWRPLRAEHIISDSTYDFQATGIIKLDVPGDINNKHTIITDGLYWFCASVTANSDRIPQLIDVVAQATEAQFVDQGNSQAHFDSALPAGTISKLSVAVSQVSKVSQPFASFDGKHQEVGKEYYTRVSERLRHKARAITAWDYEHLVLDRFPGVFKVKCITITDPNCLCRSNKKKFEKFGNKKCCGPVKVTGNVLVIPVPNLKNSNAANPLQPKTSRLTLIEIVNYLTPRTSPFVKIHARNPVYEQVLVFFRVKFLSGVDKGYYLKKLNDEIVQYLTPWAFDQTIEAQFGQKIYASSIINFVEQRPYVDFITDFLMGVCRDECCPPKKHNATKITGTKFIDAIDEVSGCHDIEAFLRNQGYFVGDVIAEPSTQMSLLVSAPKHIILLYEEPVQVSVCEKRNLALPVPVQQPTPAPQPIPAPPPVTPAPTQPVPTQPAPTQPVPTQPLPPVLGQPPIIKEPLPPVLGQPPIIKDPLPPVVGQPPILKDPLPPVIGQPPILKDPLPPVVGQPPILKDPVPPIAGAPVPPVAGIPVPTQPPVIKEPVPPVAGIPTPTQPPVIKEPVPPVAGIPTPTQPPVIKEPVPPIAGTPVPTQPPVIKEPVPPIAGTPVPPVAGIPTPTQPPVIKEPVPPIAGTPLPTQPPVIKEPVPPIAGTPVPPVAGIPTPTQPPVIKEPVPPIAGTPVPTQPPVIKEPVPPIAGTPVPPVAGIPTPTQPPVIKEPVPPIAGTPVPPVAGIPTPTQPPVIKEPVPPIAGTPLPTQPPVIKEPVPPVAGIPTPVTPPVTTTPVTPPPVVKAPVPPVAGIPTPVTPPVTTTPVTPPVTTTPVTPPPVIKEPVPPVAGIPTPVTPPVTTTPVTPPPVIKEPVPPVTPPVTTTPVTPPPVIKEPVPPVAGIPTPVTPPVTTTPVTPPPVVKAPVPPVAGTPTTPAPTPVTGVPPVTTQPPIVKAPIPPVTGTPTPAPVTGTPTPTPAPVTGTPTPTPAPVTGTPPFTTQPPVIKAPVPPVTPTPAPAPTPVTGTPPITTQPPVIKEPVPVTGTPTPPPVIKTPVPPVASIPPVLKTPVNPVSGGGIVGITREKTAIEGRTAGKGKSPGTTPGNVVSTENKPGEKAPAKTPAAKTAPKKPEGTGQAKTPRKDTPGKTPQSKGRNTKK